MKDEGSVRFGLAARRAKVEPKLRTKPHRRIGSLDR
jgi:hypothetical protein